MKTKVARKSLNTINSCNIPIIVVPGVMGTRLCFPNGKIFWDPDDSLKLIKMAFSPVNRKSSYMNAEFKLNVCQKGREDKTKEWSKDEKVVKDKEDRGWGGASWKYYGKLTESLANSMLEWRNTSKVYVFGYDWRQSNKDSGTRLFQFVQQVLVKEKTAEKVIIVTHSMGGLVTRWACKNGMENLVHGVVHITQPATGAVVFYRRFKTGIRSGIVTKDIDGGADTQWMVKGAMLGGRINGPLGAIIGGGLAGAVSAIPDIVFSKIVGKAPQDFQRIVGGVKGAFELLPTNLHPKISYKNVIDPHGNLEKVYTNWLMLDKNLKERYLPLLSNIYNVYREETGQVGLFNFKKTSADYVRMLEERWKIGDVENANWIDSQNERTAILQKEIKVDIKTGKLIKKSLNSAESFHKFLQNYAHPNTFVLAVRKHRTDTGTYLESEGNTTKATPHFAPGDSTVTIESQTALEIPEEKEFTFEKGELPAHAEICDSDEIIKKTKEFIKKIILGSN